MEVTGGPNLAKVGVAGSTPVSRSEIIREIGFPVSLFLFLVEIDGDVEFRGRIDGELMEEFLFHACPSD